MLEKEAKKRMVEAGKRTGRGNKKVPEIVPEPLTGEARDKAGSLLGVSGRYVAAAKAILAKSPELFAEIKAGDKKIPEARRELKRDEVATKMPKMPDGKFRVIYADPPWKYGDQLTEDPGADP